MTQPYKLCLAILLLSSLFSSAQINFEPGYFINNYNERTDCLIKNLDWGKNPTKFDYKVDNSSEVITASINNIKEFAVNNESKFIRRTIDIDQSSNFIDNLSNSRNPEFKQETIFLKVLNAGDATLYAYSSTSLKRFFFSVGEGPIDQLVYKKFMTSDNKIATNNYFRQQLLNELKCEVLSENDFSNLSYNRNELMQLFEVYNSCMSPERIEDPIPKRKDNIFNLNLKLGVNFTDTQVKNDRFPGENIDYGSNTSLRIGIEAEYILPINKNKWSIFTEPTYGSYEGESSSDPAGTRMVFRYIELPLGLKYYMFLNHNIKLFISGAIVYDLTLEGTITSSRNLVDFELRAVPNGAFGIGIKLSDRFIAEARYFTTIDLLPSDALFYTQYQKSAIIIGYTIF